MLGIAEQDVLVGEEAKRSCAVMPHFSLIITDLLDMK